jgi:hypothetical protein
MYICICLSSNLRGEMWIPYMSILASMVFFNIILTITYYFTYDSLDFRLRLEIRIIGFKIIFRPF